MRGTLWLLVLITIVVLFLASCPKGEDSGAPAGGGTSRAIGGDAGGDAGGDEGTDDGGE